MANEQEKIVSGPESNKGDFKSALEQAGGDQVAAVLTELKRVNDLLDKAVKTTDWKVALRNGLMFGLGSALGASILVWVAIAILKPLERIEAIKEPIERLATELQHPKSNGSK